MATAAELLAGMSTGDDTTLVIDNYLRTINIPKRVTNLGVEHDDEVLFLNFKMPRYLDDTDLSKFSIRINYINANGDSDAYTVNEDKKVVGSDFIKFSWLVGPTATAYKGTTKFIVCMKTMKTVDDQQVIDKEYNTTVASLPVLEGLEVDESIVTQYSDIIEQWREDIFGETDSEIQKIRDASQQAAEAFAESVAEVVATIPNEYAITSELAEEGVRTKADAIVNTADGAVISVSDCSNDHIRNLRVFGNTTQVNTTGAQKLPYPFTQTTRTTNGITYTDNGDGSITITGTATAKAYMDLYNKPEIPGPHFLSGVPKNSGFKMYAYTGGAYKEDTGNGVLLANGVTSVHIVVDEGTTVDTTLYPMLSEGESALPWEPYSGGVVSPSPNWPQSLENIDNTTVDICGGNLFNFKGITPTDNIVVNPDGTITVNIYSAPTGKTLKQLAPSLKVGSRYKITLDTESTNNFIYLLDVKRTWDKGATITMTDAILNSKVYVYGVNGDAPMIIRNIAIVPEGVSYNGAPYVEPQHIAISHTLRGISQNNWPEDIRDEIDFERGVYIQRVMEKTFDGSDMGGWHHLSTYGSALRFDYTTGKVKPKSNIMANMFQTAVISTADVEGINVHSSQTHIQTQILSSRLTTPDLAGFAQYLQTNPLTIVYVLNTPIETPLTTAELEAFKALYTNHPNTTVLNDSGAPMRMTYNVDTKIYLDSLPKATDEQVMDCVSAWLDSHFTSAEGVSF